jgi:hypothetical protein
VVEWARLHTDELLANWDRARQNQPPVSIPTLRSMSTVSSTYLPVVAGVAVLHDHVLRLLFDDGTVGDVDFSHEEWTGVLEPLRDPRYFAKV